MHTAEKYPIATNDPLCIINAARNRANFWGYPSNSHYTVTVRVIDTDREISYDQKSDKYFCHGVGYLN